MGIWQLVVEVVQDLHEGVERVGGPANLDGVKAETGDRLLQLVDSEVVDRSEAVLAQQPKHLPTVARREILQHRLEVLVDDVLCQKGGERLLPPGGELEEEDASRVVGRPRWVPASGWSDAGQRERRGHPRVEKGGVGSVLLDVPVGGVPLGLIGE